MIVAETSQAPVAAPPRRLDWGRALRALRRLLADNQDTTQVFEIMRALNNGSIRKGYARLLTTPEGACIAQRHVELSDRLMDRDWLAGFAEGTVGAAYREFVTREQLSAEGLAAISQTGADTAWLASSDPAAWYGRRVRDIHDLWHTLTGYGRDPLGEASLVAFSYSQTKGLGWLVIALGALAKGWRIPGVTATIREGFHNGRRARWLPAVDYETLMAQPLEAARATLRIPAPARYRRTLERHGAIILG